MWFISFFFGILVGIVIGYAVMEKNCADHMRRLKSGFRAWEDY